MQDIELISLEELSEIRRIWLEEKQEFDDSLPRIYHEVTGEIFCDPRRNAGNAYLGADEWSILVELCEDSIHLELMNRLLDTERQFQTMSRRIGLYEELEKRCKLNFASKDETLENAHRTRNLKQAATQGDVDTVKQLTTGKAPQSSPTEMLHPPNPPCKGGNKNQNNSLDQEGNKNQKLVSPNNKSSSLHSPLNKKDSSLHSPLNKGGWGGKEGLREVNKDSGTRDEPTNAIAQPTSWAQLKFGKVQSSLIASEFKADYNTEDTAPPQPETEKDYRPQGIPQIILTELVLHNFGPYRGQHTINLTSSSNEQPIVLFGGMNGGGKTTLLDGIRLALYGQRALCSTRGKLSYSDFLSECVNRQTDDEPTHIELAFQQTLNNAPQPTEFRIHRTWTRHPKNGRDKLEISKDGSSDAALTKAWDERIEDLLPLGISNLFLFDGEQVKELAEQDELPPLVTGAMRSLLGLELPDRLSTDLDVLIARKRKASANRQDLQKLEAIEHRLESLTQEKQTAKQEISCHSTSTRSRPREAKPSRGNLSNQRGQDCRRANLLRSSTSTLTGRSRKRSPNLARFGCRNPPPRDDSTLAATSSISSSTRNSAPTTRGCSRPDTNSRPTPPRLPTLSQAQTNPTQTDSSIPSRRTTSPHPISNRYLVRCQCR
jgi:hypothetical protein